MYDTAQLKVTVQKDLSKRVILIKGLVFNDFRK